jgi:AbiV family abortive infection protein
MTVEQIDEARPLILGNARALLEESELLMERGKYARAYVLAHIAGEELIKLDALIEAAILLVQGKPIDWQRVHQRLHMHTEKLREIFGPVFQAYRGTEMAEDPKIVDRYVTALNDLKNNALYVGQRRGEGPRFRTPDDLVTKELAGATRGAIRAQLEFYESVAGEHEGPLRDIVKRTLTRMSGNNR